MEESHHKRCGDEGFAGEATVGFVDAGDSERPSCRTLRSPVRSQESDSLQRGGVLELVPRSVRKCAAQPRGPKVLNGCRVGTKRVQSDYHWDFQRRIEYLLRTPR